MQNQRKQARQNRKNLDFGRLFEVDSKVNCKFYYLNKKGELKRKFLVPATIIMRKPHKILQHKIAKIIMRDLKRVTNEAKQHNVLTEVQRNSIVHDLEALLRDCVMRGITPQSMVSKYKSERERCIAYMESTVVDISIPPPSFKPVSVSLPRSLRF